MFSTISKFWAALSGLAGAITELTGTVKEANSNFRQRLGLDVAEQDNPVQLPEPDAAVSNGRRRKTVTASE